MKLYKLTTPAGKSGTQHLLQWGENITHTLPAVDSPKLCSPDVIHVYRSPHLGLLLNPIHGDYQDPVVWEGEGEVVVEDWGKAGCFAFTTTRKVDLAVTPRICLRFAVLCAESVLPLFEARFPEDTRPKQAIEMARRALAGGDVTRVEAARVARAAEAAAKTARAAAWAAETAAAAAAETAWAAAAAAAAAKTAGAAETAAAAAAKTARAAARAARAAEAAAKTARAAAWAAEAAEAAAETARAAAWAARAAETAAGAAAGAAAWAAETAVEAAAETAAKTAGAAAWAAEAAAKTARAGIDFVALAEESWKE